MSERDLDTVCRSSDDKVGILKSTKDCKTPLLNRVGYIAKFNLVLVCCPPGTTSVGEKARNYCTNQSSGRSALVDKLKNGNLSDLGEFPHMAALGFFDMERGTEFNCGGSLISTKYDRIIENFILAPHFLGSS